MSRHISRADLARRAGVSKPAITKACRVTLAAACSGDGVDVDHPAVIAYLAAKQQPRELAAKGPLGGRASAAPAPPADAAPTATVKPARRRVANPTPPAGRGNSEPPAADAAPTEEELDDVREIFDGQFDGSAEDLSRLTRDLRPIIRRFGTRHAMKHWLDALNKLEDIRKKRLDNEETEGRLISRELVKTHVFGAIDGAHRRLLGDFPKTITRLLYASANSKEPIEAAEEKVRAAVSTVLKPVKPTADRVIGTD